MKIRLMLIVLLFSFVIPFLAQYVVKERPYLNLSDDYQYYSNIYRLKADEIDMIRVANDDDFVKYFISANNGNFVRINSVDYSGFQEVVCEGYEYQFIKAEVFNKYNELQDTFSFYYGNQKSKLEFLEWYEYGLERIIWIVWGIVLLVALLSILIDNLLKKRIPSKEVMIKSNNLWQQFKAMKISDKVKVIICLIVYLFFPFPIIFILLIVLLAYIIIKIKGFKDKSKALAILILSTAIGAFTFFILYINLVPEALVDYGYEIPSITLTEEAQTKYQEMIDNVEMYSKEPIAYFENDTLGFIALRAFINWDYHQDGDITEMVLVYRFYKIDPNLKKNIIVNLRINGAISKQATNHQDNNEFIIDYETAGMATLDLVNASTGELIYQSEALAIVENLTEVNETIYYGGQYVGNEHAYLFTTISVHIGAILLGFILYRFRHAFSPINLM